MRIAACSKPSGTVASDQDLRDTIPSYTKVGLFLKQALAKEMSPISKSSSTESDSETEEAEGRHIPVFANYSDADEIFITFRDQFERYTRQHSPFNARSSDWQRPYDYWKAMSKEPNADILSVSVFICSTNILLIYC